MKYKNKPSGGFDSIKEHRRADELRLLEKIGAISELKFQPKYELIPKQEGERAAHYIADFSYMENGKLVVEDVKSEMTRKLPAFVLKRKLLLHVHQIRIRET